MNNFNKIIFSSFFILFLSIFFASAQAQTFNFYRNLSVGDRGQDVFELQKILNQDPDTIVSLSGAGSPGNETTYFGNLTKTALIKFQNKYRSQILIPVGLSYGTGYFGLSTISFIESQNMDNSPSVSLDNPEIDIEAIEIETEEVIETNNQDDDTVQEDETSSNSNSNFIKDGSIELYFVSQNVFETGDEITVVGGNVGNDPEIYFFNFDDDKVVTSVDVDSNFITFDVPNLSNGKYELYIKNGNRLSNEMVVEIVGDYNPPKISSVSPSIISYGDTVTIKGSNFTSQNNTVMTALGTYTVSSNGKEIEFFVQRPVNLSGDAVDPVEEKIEGIIQIKNSNGISDAKFVDFLYN